jgi:hypothetical protein
MPSKTSSWTSTPAPNALAAARVESSSSISLLPTWNSIGGSPEKSPVSGETKGVRNSSGSDRYISPNQRSMASENMGSLASLTVLLRPLSEKSVAGERTIAAAGSGRPSSRARIRVTRLRLPPAESPQMTMLCAGTPLLSNQRYAARQSSEAAGYGCSGASRYTGISARAPEVRHQRAIIADWVRGMRKAEGAAMDDKGRRDRGGSAAPRATRHALRRSFAG